MTRRGMTPFYQSLFSSVVEIYAESESGVEELIKTLESTATDPWENRLFHYGELINGGYTSLRISVTAADGPDLGLYSAQDVKDKDPIAFGAIVLGIASRRRDFVQGEIKLGPKGKTVSASVDLNFSLTDLVDEVNIEIVAIAKKDLVDSQSALVVRPGTIIATTNLLRLRERPTEGAFGDMFDFRWVEFDKSDQYRSGELFDIDWNATPPVLYFNESIKNFHHVMNATPLRDGPNSIKLKAREALDCTLAASVLESCGRTVLMRIAQKASEMRNEDPTIEDFAGIFEDLSSNDCEFIEQWTDQLAPEPGASDGPGLCQLVATTNASALEEHLISQMPRNFRLLVGMESTAIEILALAGLGDE